MKNNLQQRIEEKMQDYKLHNKDLDSCFNDHVAKHNFINELTDLFKEEMLKMLPEEKEINLLRDESVPWVLKGKVTKKEIRAEKRGYNRAIKDIKSKIK